MAFGTTLGNRLVPGAEGGRYAVDMVTDAIKALFVAVVMVGAASGWSVAAEQQSPNAPIPAPPSAEPPKSDVPPSPLDPGMVKEPEVKGVPGAVVTPPVVDPRMAVNPEQPPTDDTRTPRTEPPPPQVPSH